MHVIYVHVGNLKDVVIGVLSSLLLIMLLIICIGTSAGTVIIVCYTIILVLLIGIIYFCITKNKKPEAGAALSSEQSHDAND